MTPAAPSGTTSPRGDRRREALLAALDDRLKTTALDDISVADLTESAGITRSAFYFYFDSKAAAVGVLLAMRGLQKLAGLFGGPGIDGFAETLADSGFDMARALAIAGGAVELVAGVMLVVGLATPIAAAGLLGIVGLGIAVRLTGADPIPVLSDTSRGLEPSILYAAALLTLLFTGPGRWAADRKWGWSHRPRFSGIVWLVIVVVLAGLVWYFLNGTNPLTSSADSAPVTAG